MASRATARAEAPTALWRAVIRIIALVGWLVACLVPHAISSLFGHSRWPRRFLAGAAGIIGADVRLEGPEPTWRDFLIANHVSWLDIPALAGATGCAFISKSEVRDHPFLKFIADQNDTIYIDRADRRGIHAQTDLVRLGLDSDQPIALFPEGTVGDGGRLLPFKPALLAAVTPPPQGVHLHPVAIDYGEAMQEIGWGTGEGGVANFLRVLGRRGRIPVTIRILDPLPSNLDRKALARAAHDAIAEALAPSGIAPALL